MSSGGGLSSPGLAFSADVCQDWVALSCRTSKKNQQWIDYLLDGLKDKICHILKIWDCIGLDEESYNERKGILKKHLWTLLDKMISEEDKSVSDLRLVVEEMQAKVNRLNSILKVKEQPIEHNLPLIVRERSLAEAYKHLSVMLSNRIDRFRSLVAEHQRLCQRLGEPLKHYTYDYVPSTRLLDSIERDINELLVKLAQQYAGTCNHKTIQITESDASVDKQSDPTLSSVTYDAGSINVSQSAFLGLNDRVTSLRQATPTNCLRETIKSHLLELHKLFDECLVEPSFRKLFPMEPQENVLNETYLRYLEEQIHRWQDYRASHTDAIAAFYSWRASFIRLLQIEEQLHERKHITPRNNCLTNLEREALSIRERILPQLEKLLFSVARKSDGFKVFGLPVKVYVEETRREADRTPPGTPRLDSKKQTQLLIESAPSWSSSTAHKARNSSCKSQAKSSSSTMRPCSNVSNVPSDSQSLIKGTVPDENQSAFPSNGFATPVTRVRPSTQKVKWPKIECQTDTPSTPKTDKLGQPLTPRTPLASAFKTPSQFASCSRRNKVTRVVQLLEESPRPVSVVDLFRHGGNKMPQNPSELKKPGGLGSHPTKRIESQISKNAASGDHNLKPCLPSQWTKKEEAKHKPISPSSVKSDSVFATPLGRAPSARKKTTATPNLSASCSRLNQLTPRAVRLFEESSRPISVVDFFGNLCEDDDCFIATAVDAPSMAKNRTPQVTPSPTLGANQPISSAIMKGKTVFTAPVGRAPVTRRRLRLKDLPSTASTPHTAPPSRIPRPRATITSFKGASALSASCSRLNQVAQSGFPPLAESLRATSASPKSSSRHLKVPLVRGPKPSRK